MNNKELAFTSELWNTYRMAKKFKYNAQRFANMLTDPVYKDNGVLVTHHLLASGNNAQAGLAELSMNEHLELSVEAQVLKPEYRELFSDEERTIARQRLADFRYIAPWDK